MTAVTSVPFSVAQREALRSIVTDAAASTGDALSELGYLRAELQALIRDGRYWPPRPDPSSGELPGQLELGEVDR